MFPYYFTAHNVRNKFYSNLSENNLNIVCVIIAPPKVRFFPFLRALLYTISDTAAIKPKILQEFVCVTTLFYGMPICIVI